MERSGPILEISRMQHQREAAVTADLSTVRPLAVEESGRRVTRVVDINPVDLERARILRPGGGQAVQPHNHAYKMLRTQVMKRLDRLGVNNLAVVSPRSGDGKTLTAINLSISLAGDPAHTVLLVDLDLHRPGVAQRFGVAVEAGVEDYLQARTPIDRLLLRPDGYERLVMLPAKQSTPDSSELLLGSRARELAAELKGRYANRIVIYDLPPVLEADDALAFMRNVDAVLLVVRDCRSQREEIARTLELLHDKPVLGTVLNASRESPGKYY